MALGAYALHLENGHAQLREMRPTQPRHLSGRAQRGPYIWKMVTPSCEKCGRRNLVIFQVEPREAWRTVMRDRWKSICPHPSVPTLTLGSQL